MALIPGIGGSAGAETKNKVDKTARELAAVNIRLDQLENRFKELRFTNQALWELLKERSDLNDEALEEKVTSLKQEIEQRANETTTCSSCNRVVPAHKENCYYCGTKLS